MSKRLLNTFLFLFLFMLISNCSDGDGKSNGNRISFAADGITKVFEGDGRIYTSWPGSNCIYNDVPLGGESYADLRICWEIDGDFTTQDIQSLEGKELSFSSTDVPHASFYYRESGIHHDADYVSDQTGSKVSITDVVSHGDGAFHLIGTFNVKVASQRNGTAVTLTGGAFTVGMLKP